MNNPPCDHKEASYVIGNFWTCSSCNPSEKKSVDILEQVFCLKGKQEEIAPTYKETLNKRGQIIINLRSYTWRDVTRIHRVADSRVLHAAAWCCTDRPKINGEVILWKINSARTVATSEKGIELNLSAMNKDTKEMLCALWGIKELPYCEF